MRYYYDVNEERQMSRAEKIMEAKSAFSGDSRRNARRGYGREQFARGSAGDEGHPVRGGYDSVSARYGITGIGEEQAFADREKHHIGMLRMIIAGVLFFVMVLTFHYDVSFKGYGKADVEQLLSDDSHWDSLVNQVTKVMKQYRAAQK